MACEPLNSHLTCRIFSSKLAQVRYIQCLQAYGFIRILYGIALENTEYGESDLIYGYSF